MPEHQHPRRDPVLAPSTFPDDGDEEYTLLIESQDVERDAGPEDQDETDDDDEGFDDEDDDEEVEGKFEEALTRLPAD